MNGVMGISFAGAFLFLAFAHLDRLASFGALGFAAKVRREADKGVARIEEVEKRAVTSLNHYAAIHWYEMSRAVMETQGRAYLSALKYACYAIHSGVLARWDTNCSWWGKLLERVKALRKVEQMQDAARHDEETREALAQAVRLLKSLVGGVSEELRRELQALLAEEQT